MKTKLSLLVAASGLMVAAGGCLPNSKSGRGFHLPEGDAMRGKTAFVTLNCVECHRVEGVELPAPEKRDYLLVLGGEVTRVRTYGELVTSIIHPQRSISPVPLTQGQQPVQTSPMKDLNATMTVRQLIDLATFLEPTYRKVVPEFQGAGI